MLTEITSAPAATMDRFATTADPRGVPVTPEAIATRFTPPLTPWLRAGREHRLEHALAADPAAVPRLERFTAIEVGASSP